MCKFNWHYLINGSGMSTTPIPSLLEQFLIARLYSFRNQGRDMYIFSVICELGTAGRVDFCTCWAFSSKSARKVIWYYKDKGEGIGFPLPGIFVSLLPARMGNTATSLQLVNGCKPWESGVNCFVCTAIPQTNSFVTPHLHQGKPQLQNFPNKRDIWRNNLKFPYIRSNYAS